MDYVIVRDISGDAKNVTREFMKVEKFGGATKTSLLEIGLKNVPNDLCDELVDNLLLFEITDYDLALKMLNKFSNKY